MIISTISGGIMSFYAAYSTIKKYGKDNVLLYFNDTKWEHRDLYRFLDDISLFLGKDIIYDSDGRSPDQIFFDERFLGCNRVPLCSRILKAERLQRFYKDGDTLIFGIGIEEYRRMQRIIAAYQIVYAKTNKYCQIEFPLIEQKIPNYKINEWFALTGIKKPELYEMGFEHNNCSGGCVRQGKKQWRKLLKLLPEVYQAREDLETRFQERFGKGSFLKDMTLKQLREDNEYGNDIDLFAGECIGVCQFIA
jgi:3'-phosphoadenosine 5'-phosphosulfate sulfotransferase (PAPS reductase)/FAD synthetase